MQDSQLSLLFLNLLSVCFLRIRRLPVAILTDALFPYATLFLFRILGTCGDGGVAMLQHLGLKLGDGRGEVRIVVAQRLQLLGIILVDLGLDGRSEEHTSELQPLMRISYAAFFLKKNISITLNRL